MLEAGIKGRKELVVTNALTAKEYASGDALVYATPALVALAEGTALESVRPELEEGQATVGTNVNIDHIAATPVGMKVWCESELIEVDRRRLVFKIEVFDECEKVAEGTHERFIIFSEKFQAKADAKLNR